MEKTLYCVRPEFRAPPPSPMGYRSDSTENNEDDELIGYLRRTVRTPTLSLPDKIVSHKKAPTWNPPEIDLRFLNSNEKGATNVEILKMAAAKYGCFQIVNHGINMKMVDTVLEMAPNQIFSVSEEKMEMKGERVWGFEIEREEDEEGKEVLWWGKDRREGEGEDSKDILSHEYMEFCAKMENLQSQMEEIGFNIAQILQQDSIISTSTEEKQIRSFLRFHTHNGGLEKAKDSLINHEVLHMLVRDTKVPRTLTLHICKHASEFRVYTKRGQSSFRPLNDAIIVTIGNQAQEWGNGLYKNVIGRPVYPKNNSINSTSIEFLYSHSTNTSRNSQDTKSVNTISIFHQVIIVTTCITLLYHLGVSLFYIY